MSVNKNIVSSTNSTNNNILNSEYIGKIKSILAKVGVIVAIALLTAIITESFGLASGNNEKTLIRIICMKSSIWLFIITTITAE